MKAKWLRHQGADHLIVVFGGWAVGEMPFAHLPGAADVLLLSDYRDLTLPHEAMLPYAQRSLLAYSYGVGAAGHVLGETKIHFARKVAVCGSLYPCDDSRGIPPETVRRAADHLSAESLQHFARRAGCSLPASVDIEALQAELYATLQRGPRPSQAFDLIWLSRRDRIFPPANLERAWDGLSSKLRWLDAGHSPFFLFESWEALLA